MITPRAKVAAAAFYLAVTIGFVSAFARYPNRSPLWMSEWIALYVMGLILPGVWTYRLMRVLDTHGIRVCDAFFTIVAPAMFGALAMLMALNLLRGV